MAALDHGVRERASGLERREVVEPQHRFVIAPQLTGSCVVHEDVHSTQLCERGLGERIAGPLRTQIRLDGHRIVGQFAHQPLEIVHASRRQRDASSLCCQRSGRVLADSPAGARDERGSSLEFHVGRLGADVDPQVRPAERR